MNPDTGETANILQNQQEYMGRLLVNSGHQLPLQDAGRVTWVNSSQSEGSKFMNEPNKDLLPTS